MKRGTFILAASQEFGRNQLGFSVEDRPSGCAFSFPRMQTRRSPVQVGGPCECSTCLQVLLLHRPAKVKLCWTNQSNEFAESSYMSGKTWIDRSFHQSVSFRRCSGIRFKCYLLVLNIPIISHLLTRVPFCTATPGSLAL